MGEDLTLSKVNNTLGSADYPFSTGETINLYITFYDENNNRFWPEEFKVRPKIYDSQGNELSGIKIYTRPVDNFKIKVSFSPSGLVPGLYTLKAEGVSRGISYPVEGKFELVYEGVREALLRRLREYMYDQDTSLYRFEVFDRNKHLWTLNQMWIAIEMTFYKINMTPWVTEFTLFDEQGNEGFPVSWLPYILEGAAIQLLETRATLEVANTLMDGESNFQIDRQPRYLAIASQKRAMWKMEVDQMKRAYFPMSRGSRSYRIPAGFMIRQLGLRLDLQDIFASSTNPSATTFYTSIW